MFPSEVAEMRADIAELKNMIKDAAMQIKSQQMTVCAAGRYGPQQPRYGNHAYNNYNPRWQDHPIYGWNNRVEDQLPQFYQQRYQPQFQQKRTEPQPTPQRTRFDNSGYY